VTTLHDLEQTIVFLASNYASAICQLDGTEARAKEVSDRLIAAREEVEALLTENASLREKLRVAHEISDLRGKLQLEFCQKYEVEEVRANTYRQERDDARQTLGLVRLECERLHAATSDDLRTIEGLRDSLAKAIRKLHAVRFGAKKAKAKR
jgi:hypothetical protein